MLIICFQDTLNSHTQRLIENDTILRLTEDSPAAATLHRPELLCAIKQNNKHHSSVCVCLCVCVGL